MRAKMEKVTFSCGHEGYIHYFNAKERTEKEAWAAESGVCGKCYRKALRDRAAAEATENKEACGLPDLQGTEKQIAWAETIRSQTLEAINRAQDRLNDLVGAGLPESKKVRFSAQLDDALSMLAEMTSAHWWIDNRDDAKNVPNLLDLYHKEIATIEQRESPVVQDAIQEMTLVPPEVRHEGVAEITVSGNTVRAKYQRNEDFRKILRYELKYSWNGDEGCWQRVCDKFSGSAVDRAAEAVNKLLSKGFRVLCTNGSIRQAAADATYEPEQKRWVSWLVKSKKLAIRWEHGNDVLYLSASSLPDAHWNHDNGSIDVPLRNWREVLDFADLNGFSVSDVVKKHIDAVREEVIGVVKTKKAKKMPSQSEQLNAVMQNTGIPDDLRDD